MPKNDEDRVLVDLKNDDQWSFINNQKHMYESERNRSLAETNESERALCGQLMLITTVLITGNVVIIGDFNNLTSLTFLQRLLVLLGLALLAASVISGVKYYFEMIKFHGSWARANNEAAGVFVDLKFKYWDEVAPLVKKTVSGQPNATDESWLKLQMWSLILALTTYLVLGAAIMFDFSGTRFIF